MKWYQYIFSIKNMGNHKVICLMFIKIKINRKINTEQQNYKIQNESYIKKVFDKPYSSHYDLNKLDIAFIVPQPIKGSGGHRNFYRAIKYLKNFGHDLTVYYTQTKEPADIVKQKVSDWFYDMSEIPFICYEGKLGYHDACIATWWETAYELYRNKDKIKKSFYFVQDFEPMFYPMSSGYILAENSYKLGFMHICSGPWCKEFLINKYNARAEYFQFPVDTKIYNMREERTKKNKNVIFFAKPDLDRRCFELGILALKEFHDLMPDVEIILFGSNHIHSQNIPFACTKIGLLPTIKDLADLYRNADLGLVFSTTNPSLVPFEMMACGCPIADIDVYNALAKYGNNKDNVFLLNPIPEIMGKQLAKIINNENELLIKKSNGQIFVKKEFPDEKLMADRVLKIIKNEFKEV